MNAVELCELQDASGGGQAHEGDNACLAESNDKFSLEKIIIGKSIGWKC